jgi:hypothetical protein
LRAKITTSQKRVICPKNKIGSSNVTDLANGRANESGALNPTRDGKPGMRGSVGWLADHTV